MSTVLKPEVSRRPGVTVFPPKGFAAQFVFRQELMSPVPLDVRNSWSVIMMDGALSGVRHVKALCTAFGTAGAAKAIAKLATGRRKLLLIRDGSSVVFHAWTMASKCKYYPIEASAVVIGPIWTSPKCRGQGIATCGVKSLMNELMRKGHTTFYIDTTNDNASCLRAIEKCGFGAPIGLYCRLVGGTL